MDRDTRHTGPSYTFPPTLLRSRPSGVPMAPSGVGGRRCRDAVDGRDRGFTLVELLVVIIIVGLLAGIAIPMYLNQRKKSVDASLRADLKQAGLMTETLLGNPLRLMHPDAFIPQGPRVTTYDLFQRVGFKPSPGNVVRISGDPDAGWYLLCAYNPGATTATGQSVAMLYDSRNGGIQSAAVSCPPGWGTYTNTSWYGMSYSEYGAPAPEPWAGAAPFW